MSSTSARPAATGARRRPLNNRGEDGFVYRAGVMVDLGPLPGSHKGRARAFLLTPAKRAPSAPSSLILR